MVAGDEHHPRAVAGLAQDALDDVVMRPWPMPVLAQLPAVHDVAHQIQGVRVVVVQEIKQKFRLAPGSAQVYVGNPEGTPVCGADFVHGRFHVGCRHA
ncbi:hypothetical protein D3C78_1518240 [compost metagenome]